MKTIAIYVIKVISFLVSEIMSFLLLVFLEVVAFILKFFVAILISLTSDYDPEKADTQEARDGLQSICKIEDFSEVKQIYYARVGFIRDPEYYYAFYAPPHIIDEIVKNRNLSETDDKDASSAILPEWWNAEIREKSKCYTLHNEELRETWTLWYEPESQYAQIMILYD